MGFFTDYLRAFNFFLKLTDSYFCHKFAYTLVSIKVVFKFPVKKEIYELMEANVLFIEHANTHHSESILPNFIRQHFGIG